MKVGDLVKPKDDIPFSHEFAGCIGVVVDSFVRDAEPYHKVLYWNSIPEYDYESFLEIISASR